MKRIVSEVQKYESVAGSETRITLKCQSCNSIEMRVLSEVQLALYPNYRELINSECYCDSIVTQHRVRCRIAGAIQRSYRGRMSK